MISPPVHVMLVPAGSFTPRHSPTGQAENQRRIDVTFFVVNLYLGGGLQVVVVVVKCRGGVFLKLGLVSDMGVGWG